MQLTSLSLALTRAGFLSFSPASLFAASEPGVWYDPSDFSTMFQDAAGTTPVTAVEQPVGLMLDKSKGLVLGPELVTNGDFSSGTTGWTAGTGGSAVTLSVVNQRLRLTKTSTAAFGSAVQQITGLDAAKRYKFSCNGYVGTAEVRVLLGGAMEMGTVYNGAQSASDIAPVVYVTGVTSFWITVLAYGGNATYAEFDNISVREIPGNHATQTTATSRPVLSARYNLLTKTEQFDDAVWVKQSTAVTPSYGVTPDGKASTLIAHSAQFANVNQTVSIAAGVQYKIRFYARRVTGNNTLYVYGGVANQLLASFSPTPDWSLFEIQFTPASSSTRLDFCQDRAASGFGSVEIGPVDLRVANVGTNLPAYQRVNTATDYDADPSKFKPYLRFDGIDDWLVTPTITPGTDKAQVFAGVRKLSDAAAGLLLESSANINSNNGAFFLGAPSNANPSGDYGVASRGSVFSGTTTARYAVNAPDTSVVTMTADIAGDVVALRTNGVGRSSGTGDQGTGNYLAYPLYIGRRGGTTLPFNGHLYGLIVRFGANLPAGTIASTESWVADKTGITL